MGDAGETDDRTSRKAAHEPPPGAETTGTWTAGATSIDYGVSAKWLVLRKKEKPSSAILHMGAVGPQRVAFPADGGLPQMPPRLVVNEESWLAFTDLVFIDPVGTRFSRVIDDEG